MPKAGDGDGDAACDGLSADSRDPEAPFDYVCATECADCGAEPDCDAGPGI